MNSRGMVQRVQGTNSPDTNWCAMLCIF